MKTKACRAGTLSGCYKYAMDLGCGGGGGGRA
jgi:hypothetical protein